MKELTQKELKIIKSSPAAFAEYISEGRWHSTEHLDFIDKVLVQASKKVFNRIVINLPPRHGKSELISKYFPAWYLWNFPTHRIILTSYETKFAISWGRKVRDIIKDYGDSLLNIKLNPSSKSVDSFEILDYGGGMNCVGSGGALTGRGADLLLIDDPVKNDAQANSETMRENLYEWFQSTAFTRLEPNGTVIIIMTRWHEDDICGRIISNKDFQINKLNNEYMQSLLRKKKAVKNDNINDWFLLKIPAIAEEEDPLGREQGTALWEKRFPLKRLNEIKTTIGNYWFSALYQQRPAPHGGGIFKRKFFKYFSSDDEYYFLKNYPNEAEKKYLKSDISLYGVMDLASTLKETSDYTVILLFGLTYNREVLILDIIRERFEGADHINLLNQFNERWKPVLIGIESTQYQISLVQSALRAGLPVCELKPDKDKVSRALPISARLEAGGVYFLEKASWLDSFENELLYFPTGKHDDQVDAFAYISTIIQPVSNILPTGTKLKNKSLFTTRYFE